MTGYSPLKTVSYWQDVLWECCRVQAEAFRRGMAESRRRTMTEQQWLASNDPARMLTMFRYNPPNVKPSDRKLRLFACACCRQGWHLLKDERSRKAVEVAERFADGEVNEAVRSRAWSDALSAWEMNNNTAGIARYAVADNILAAIQRITRPGLRDVDAAVQAALLRCIVGNPFRPVTLPPALCSKCGGVGSVERRKQRAKGRFLRHCVCESPSRAVPWLTPTVLRLAQTAYDSRDFEGLPVLADALEEAGCDNEDILMHCRGYRRAQIDDGLRGFNTWVPCKIHARGCWVIDLILGKE